MLFHYCRTVTAPYFEDDTNSIRAMRTEEGKTEYVPASMKYEEWYKKYVELLNDKLEYSDIKSILSSKYIPETFEKFEHMKYNNKKEYDQLLREYNTISKVKNKEWNDSFKEKAIDTYYEFRDYGYELTDHFLARYLQRKRKDIKFNNILEILKKPINFTEVLDKKNIRYYNLVRIISNKSDNELVTIVFDPNDKALKNVIEKKWVKK